jgi:hypothetical protein
MDRKEFAQQKITELINQTNVLFEPTERSHKDNTKKSKKKRFKWIDIVLRNLKLLKLHYKITPPDLMIRIMKCDIETIPHAVTNEEDMLTCIDLNDIPNFDFF